MTNDEWLKERARGIAKEAFPDGTPGLTEYRRDRLQDGIIAFGQSCIERGKAEQQKALLAAEAKLARLENPNEALEAVVEEWFGHDPGTARGFLSDLALALKEGENNDE